MAALNNRIEAAKLLLDAGANIDLEDMVTFFIILLPSISAIALILQLYITYMKNALITII